MHRSQSPEELEKAFEKDSVVRDTATTTLGSGSTLRIFEKGGKPLLFVTVSGDSIRRIENVRIMDPRYHTEEGIGLGSTFGEIRKHYRIRKIVTALNNVVVFVKGRDFYFTISRDQLPASLRYNRELSVEEVHIPDNARIKYLMIGWDE